MGKSQAKTKKCLVTGGSGFLAGAVIDQLILENYEVSAIVRRHDPNLETKGIKQLIGDLRDFDFVMNALQNIEVVFHIAAKVGYWGDEKIYFETNVIGTQSLLQSSLQNGVKFFIYSSTPSVVGYAVDVQNGKQNLPYAKKHLSVYSKTKALAEQSVLSIDQSKLKTLSLRPHLIFGPKDQSLLPKLILSAKKGRLPIIGNREIRVDLTYVHNAAYAHIQALKALINNPIICEGKSYFISNNEPVKFWGWFNSILEGIGEQKVQKRQSLKKIRFIAHGAEIIWSIFRLKSSPPLTRFLVDALTKHHWYDQTPAQNDLDYYPKTSMKEATIETIKWFSEKNKH